MKTTTFLTTAVNPFTLDPQVSPSATPLATFNSEFVSAAPTAPCIKVSNSSSTNYAINEGAHGLTHCARIY